MAGAKGQLEGVVRQQAIVDWEAVDQEVKSVPPEYREFLFHPLKHVVEVFSSADPQGLTQELREASERLGYQLDAVVEGYHTGFARSIQNYSQILHLFQESKEQVESMKRSLADAAKQLGAQSKYMNTQWRKTVSLESSLRLLADITTVVEMPARVDAALSARDWPRAVSCLLEGATLLAHHELRRVGALRKLRSDMVALAGWIQDQMLDELTARIYSGSRASTSAAAAAAATASALAATLGSYAGASGVGSRAGSVVIGATAAGGGGGLAGGRVGSVTTGGGFVGGGGVAAAGRQVPGWRRKGPEPAYKLVTDTLHASRTASTELRNALSLPSGSGSGLIQGGAGGDGGGGGGGGRTQPSGAKGGVGGLGGGPGGGGGGLMGGDITVDVEGAMRHVATRDLVACLAQVDGVVEAKQHVARKARAEIRALIRRSVEAFLLANPTDAALGPGPGPGRGGLGMAGGGVGGGGGRGGGAAGSGSGSDPGASPALRAVAQRLMSHVAGTCLQALGRMQHVLVELANAPATTQSSALDVLVDLRRGPQGGGGGLLAGGGGGGGGREAMARAEGGGGGGPQQQQQHSRLSRGPGHGGGRAGGGGGLTARERMSYLREEYQKMWEAMQEELQLLLAELLQSGAMRRRPHARRVPGARGGGGGEAGGGGGGGFSGGQQHGAQGGGGGGGGVTVRSLLSDLNPVHFLEQLAALAEKTADLAETALGGGGGAVAAPAGGKSQPPPPQLLHQGQGQGALQGGGGKPGGGGAPPGGFGAGGPPAGAAAGPAAAAAAARRRHDGSKLTFGFDVTVPGLSADQLQLAAAVGFRGNDGDPKGAGGYGPLVQRALGDGTGSLHLLLDIYLPTLHLIHRGEETLLLPPDLATLAAGGAGSGAGGLGLSSAPSFASPPSALSLSSLGGGSATAGRGGSLAQGIGNSLQQQQQAPLVVVVYSWLPDYLDEVVLEQLLPQVWVELRGRCTAALDDVEAFRAQVGFSAAAAVATAAAAAGGLMDGASSAAAVAGSSSSASSSFPSSIAPRSVVPIARFIEGVLRELAAAAVALPPFRSAFLAIAERILDRMLGAFLHMVRQLSADCPSARLACRTDVCLTMASEPDALLLREPVAFAPQPLALPGAAPGTGPGGSTACPPGGGPSSSSSSSAAGPSSASSSSDLVAFLLTLRSQERPLLVPPQLRPLASGGGSGGGHGRSPTLGFGADGDAAEAELQYFAMRERPAGQERLVFGQQGSADRGIHLAAMSESLDYVAEAVMRLSAEALSAEAGGGGAGALGADGAAAGGGQARGGARRGGRGGQQAGEAAGGSKVPELLLPVVQSYKALAGHCCRLLRLEALLLVATHLAPVAASSHVCEEGDSMELHPSLGGLTRAALRSSEDLVPFLQPTKRAYVFGPLAGAAARGVMWLLPAIHDINSLGVERMIRALSLLQPPLTSLVTIDVPPAAAAAAAAGGGAVAGGAGGGDATISGAGLTGAAAAAAAAMAAAAAATAVPTVSGPGPSAAALAALLLHPEARGERGRLYNKARSYYGLLLVPADEVVRSAVERPGQFLYAEWMALLQARVPHRTITDVSIASLQRSLDRAFGFTTGAKVAEVVGAVVGAVQAPAERLGDVLLEGLMAGKDTLVAGVRVPAQTLQRVFKRIGGAAGGKSRGRGRGDEREGGGAGGGRQEA